MTVAKWASLVLRWLMEAGIVLGLAFWGYHSGNSIVGRILLAVFAPAVVFGFWGFVDFRWMGRNAEVVRLIQELAITALVAVALIVAKEPAFGWLVVAISIGHHVLLYATGDSLLKNKT